MPLPPTDSISACIPSAIHQHPAPWHTAPDTLAPSTLAPGTRHPCPVLCLQPILREVVGQRPLADSHQLRGVLLHAAGVFQRASDRLAFHPLDVLSQLQ